MSQYDYKPEYKRHLPHIQPPGAILFVTFHLTGSIPKQALERLKREAEEKERIILQTAESKAKAKLLYEEQKRQFARWDDLLDRPQNGPYWLRRPEIAKIVADSLHYLDREKFDLDAFCVMPNHVHALFSPLEIEDGRYQPLQTIMPSLKRHTAREANKLLKREGTFWQHESYDHIVRDRQEYERIVAYILNNPVKAGLVERWEDWPWTYLKE